VSVITTRKKNVWLRKLLHLCYTRACHLKSFDFPETEGINVQMVPFSIHVRAQISYDGPMLQIREVTEGSNNTKKANTAMRRLNNSQKQVTITKYFSKSPLHMLKRSVKKITIPKCTKQIL
jgi:hypothetical protein